MQSRRKSKIGGWDETISAPDFLLLCSLPLLSFVWLPWSVVLLMWFSQLPNCRRHLLLLFLLLLFLLRILFQGWTWLAVGDQFLYSSFFVRNTNIFSISWNFPTWNFYRWSLPVNFPNFGLWSHTAFPRLFIFFFHQLSPWFHEDKSSRCNSSYSTLNQKLVPPSQASLSGHDRERRGRGGGSHLWPFPLSPLFIIPTSPSSSFLPNVGKVG